MNSRYLVRLSLLIIITLVFVLVPGVLAQEYTSPGNVGIEPSITYVVEADDTLLDISTAYNVPLEQLQIANNLALYDQLYPGQVLTIPLDKQPIQDFAQVGFTDSLDILSVRYGVERAEIGRLNKIVNPALIYAGQPLDLGITRVEVADRDTPITRLESDSRLWNLAVRSNRRISELALLNAMENPYAFAPGKNIFTPEFTRGRTLTDPWQYIRVEPESFMPGRTYSVAVSVAVPGTVSGTFLDKVLLFVDEGDYSVALIAVDRFQTSGLFPLRVVHTDESGKESVHERLILVVDGNYPQEGIFISEEVLSVLRDDQSVSEEVVYLATIMSGFSEERRWDSGSLWMMPAPGIMSSGFGTSRVYNQGDLTSWHPGSDLAAPVGTPIYAPAGGVVVDTANLEVRGLATVISHGRGVYTGYWHQANILVEPGDVVEPGQQIGAIGNTGLSTAAHVHWEMRVNGTLVEPLQWVRELKP